MYKALDLVGSFTTILSTYFNGMTVLIEPSPPESSLLNPVIQLFCHDTSICLLPICSKFKNVIFTGNQLQPIDQLPKMLGIDAKVRSFSFTIPRNNFGPFLMTKGAD